LNSASQETDFLLASKPVILNSFIRSRCM